MYSSGRLNFVGDGRVGAGLFLCLVRMGIRHSCRLGGHAEGERRPCRGMGRVPVENILGRVHVGKGLYW